MQCPRSQGEMRGQALGTGYGAFLEMGAVYWCAGCALHRGAQQRGQMGAVWKGVLF